MLRPDFADSLCSLRGLGRLRKALLVENGGAESMRSLVGRLLAEDCVLFRLLNVIDRKASLLAEVTWGVI